MLTTVLARTRLLCYAISSEFWPDSTNYLHDGFTELNSEVGCLADIVKVVGWDISYSEPHAQFVGTKDGTVSITRKTISCILFFKWQAFKGIKSLHLVFSSSTPGIDCNCEGINRRENWICSPKTTSSGHYLYPMRGSSTSLNKSYIALLPARLCLSTPFYLCLMHTYQGWELYLHMREHLFYSIVVLYAIV